VGKGPFFRIDFAIAPAVPIALAMIAGVCLSRCVAIAPSTWLGVGALLLAIAVGLRRHSWLTSGVLILCTMVVALALSQATAYFVARDHITHYATDLPRLCQLRLYLPYEPRLRTMTFGQRFPSPPRQVTLARVQQVLTTNGWIDARGDVLVQIREPNPLIAAGQTVQIVGMLERPGVAMNPGQFDWQRYYRDMGVFCSVQIPHAANLKILDDSPAPWLTRLRESARRALALGFEPEASLDHALLGALVLGDYDPELRDVKDQFRKTGTSHHLAISGMHIGVVGGMVFLILRLMRFGPRVCWVATMAAVAFYGLIATPSPPVLRSVILFLVVGAAFLTARFSRIVQLLALTVAVMLLLQPLDLFNAGFQLSFVTVLGLILFSRRLSVRFVNELDVLKPSELALRPRAERVKQWVDSRSVLVLCTAVVAWLVSMPLIALHFSQLNPWAVPASILLAPFVVVALCAGVIKILFTWIIPSSAGPLAGFAEEASAAMRWCVDLLARCPAGDVPLTAPPWWVIALCWVAIAALVVRWRMTMLRFGSIAFLFGVFGYMLAGPYVFGSSNRLRAGQVRVTLMAVGAGQCALVEPAGGRVVLVDCGSNSLTDLNANVVVPVLRELGHTSIDTIFITHANTDHYSGVTEIADAYGVREIVVGEEFEEMAKQTGTGTALLRDLNTLELPPRIAHPGDRIPLGSGCAMEVLWPKIDAGLKANDTSLVTRLRVGDRSILFTGDIQADGMKALLDSGRDLKSQVLVAMHHGSYEDVTAEFVERVMPSWIVSSNDRTLTGKQRRFDELVSEKNVLRTHEHGAITILFGTDGKTTVEGFVTPR
jgi:competence protein ComEC